MAYVSNLCVVRLVCRYTYDFGISDKRGNLFKELNVDLRMLSTLSPEDHASLTTVWAPFMKNMLSAVSKVPKNPQVKYFRGRPENFTDLRALYAPGREVVWAAFTSVSKNVDQAAYLASWDVGCVLELTLFDVRDISRFSFYPQEEEGLLVTNTKLTVLADTRVEKRRAADGQEFLVKFIALQQLGRGPQLIS
jgi:hypothetical protein